MENKVNIDSISPPSNFNSENSTHDSYLKTDKTKLSSQIIEKNHKIFLCTSNGVVEINRKSAFKSNFSFKRLKAPFKKSNNCLDIIKEMKTVPIFDSNKNYCFEYCNIFKKNELILETIKDFSIEIENMKLEINNSKSKN